MTAPNLRRKWVYALASILFFLSGGTGLAYEIVWFKRFSSVWGSSYLAVAAVVGSFLFSLGLGAYFLGPLADRARFPLFGYGLCQLGIGALALAVPYQVRWLLAVAGRLYPLLHGAPLVHYVARFALTLAVLGPPCVLMGASLPLLISQFVPPKARLGPTAAWLYAVNTLGASAGCYVSGFHLLPALGLFWTNVGAVAVSVGVGILACTLVWQLRRPARGRVDEWPPPAGAASVPDGEPGAASALPVHLAAALSGCAALILEVVWARQLTLILGGTTYAFTAMLVVVLAGIGLGSLAFRVIGPRARRPARMVVFTVLTVVAGVLVGKALIPEVTRIVSLLAPARSSLTL
ncbi:MAG: spermidine synthase family protein, partial [Planctomycetota bacterium]